MRNTSRMLQTSHPTDATTTTPAPAPGYAPAPRRTALLSPKRLTGAGIVWPLAALALLLLFNLVFTEGFFHVEVRDGRLYGSVIDILNRCAPLMLLSLGMTLVIATGGVDLSVGAVMAIAGATAACLISNAGLVS